MDEYADHVSDKASDNREAFQRLMADASRRKFDLVVVWALDRFTREGVLKTFEHVEKLRRYGVEFESFTEAHFRTTGPAGELMLAIAAWIAKQERQRIQERVRVGLQRARAQGTKSGKPIGSPKVVFRRDQSQEMRRQGMSWGKIVKIMGVSVGSVRRACEQGPTISLVGGVRP